MHLEAQRTGRIVGYRYLHRRLVITHVADGQGFPAKETVVPGTKPEPVSVTVWLPPASNCAGVAELTIGTGLTRVRVYEVETMGLAVVVAVMVTLVFAGMY